MKTKSLLWLILLGLSGLACQSSLLIDLIAIPGDVLYRDDFSTTSGPWPVGDFPGGLSAYREDAYLVQLDVSGRQFLATSKQIYRDVVVEVDVRQTAGKPANLFGLICRYLDERNYYFFVIAGDGYFGLGKMQDGQAVLLGQTQMSYSRDIRPDGVNRLTFSCASSTLTGSINGQIVALAEDVDFPSGDAGFVVTTLEDGGLVVYFDNFLVTHP
ncbi:MAG: hypothetical protein N2049_00450 [Anaerolineales bacterium]|nr:hypothetical protein [Anaerolineales bacterium]MCX7607674.1 hypothetical protein [Anaerolineales bacterium]MDW8226983.1 hypothetical protein [Anaerolineales bacterium]